MTTTISCFMNNNINNNVAINPELKCKFVDCLTDLPTVCHTTLDPTGINFSTFKSIFQNGASSVVKGVDYKVKNFFKSYGDEYVTTGGIMTGGAKFKILSNLNKNKNDEKYTDLKNFDDNFNTAWQIYCQHMVENLSCITQSEISSTCYIGFTFSYDSIHFNPVITVCLYGFNITPTTT
jgi:hypothetical protein